MFSNRYFYTKVVICLAIIISSFIYSSKTGRFINPSFWVCQLRPNDFNEKIIWVPYSSIEKKVSNGFIINTNGHKITVKGDTRNYSVGNNISIVGKFIKSEDGGYIELQKVSKPPFTHNTRLFSNIISLAILLYVLALFVRTFHIRLAEGILHTKEHIRNG